MSRLVAMPMPMPQDMPEPVVNGGYGYASVSRRVVATLIDMIAIVAVGACVYLLAGRDPVLTGLCVVSIAVMQWGWQATRGCTIGKVIMRLRTVRDERDAADPRAGLLPAGLRRAAIRAVVELLGMACALVGALILEITAAMDRGRHRAWQDRLAGTAVVDVSARTIDAVGRNDDDRDVVDDDSRGDGRAISDTTGGIENGPEGDAGSGMIPDASAMTATGTATVTAAVPPASPISAPLPAYAGQRADASQSNNPITSPYQRQRTALTPSSRPAGIRGAQATVQPPLEPQSTLLPQSMPVSGRRQQPAMPVMPVVPVAPGSATPIFGGYDPKTGRRTMPSRPVAERGQSVAAPSSRSAVAVPARTGAQTRTGAQGATSGGTIPVPPRTTPAPAPKLTAMLYFENGTAHELSIPGQAVLGRRPSSSDPSAMLVPVPDTTGTISRSHALLEISAGRLWITDLNSTNGTEIMEDGELLRLQPKQRREIPFGTRIMLGSTAVSVNLLRNRDRGAHNGRGRQ